MNTITDAELNRRLAENLGWRQHSDVRFHAPDGSWHTAFSPATDRNHFAEYVSPEIYKRNLASTFEIMLSRATGPDDWLFILRPRVLALAALKVLEGKP